MEFVSIEKKYDGKFITFYNATYKTASGNAKVYEMISRNKNLKDLSDIRGKDCDAVILIVTSPDKSKILLSKEYRMATGGIAVNFPAGLIDAGETPEQAAKRELKEETGLDLISVEEILPSSFSGVGLTNERSCCVIGTADGEFSQSSSEEEEISASWYTKEEVRQLLKEDIFAARTQAYCYLWAKE